MNFADLVHDFGELLGEDLQPYQNRMIRFLVNDNLNLQIETDFMGEFLLLVCIITEIPPGKFRENVLRDALKANYLLDEHKSILCYEEKDNQLLLYFQIPMHGLTAEKLLEQVIPLIKRAELWRDAVNHGRTSPGRGEVPEGKRRNILPF